ncbi:putative SOS response-associated peptidase YedK [Rhizobium laguerreae]
MASKTDASSRSPVSRSRIRQEQGGNVPNAWFARDESKPLMFFAGLHVPQW